MRLLRKRKISRDGSRKKKLELISKTSSQKCEFTPGLVEGDPKGYMYGEKEKEEAGN